jgi:DNA-binding MarR family transcriptional regulator
MAIPNYAEIRDGLRAFYTRSQRMFDRLAAPYGLSVARLVLMAYIAEHGGVRSADIIKDFSLAPRTVTEAIDAMEAEGIVLRRADPSDRRAKVISLTPAGEKLLKKVEPLRERLSEQLLSVLSRQEQAQFAELLGKLNRRLDELEANADQSDAG